MPLPTEAFSFAPNNGGWSPIWDEVPAGVFGSVNAGDPGLYVGGGGVNAAFGRSLRNPTTFAALHTAAINLAADRISSDSTLETFSLLEVPQPYQYCATVARCHVRLVPELVSSQDYTTGAVIIDVFDPSMCPNHANNKAMIYVIGPQGRHRTAQQFLAAVELTASNVMLALNEYNTKAVPKLDIVRMCLISGGVFKHKATAKDDVAQAIVRGISKYWRNQLSPRIDFAWDQDAFQHAFRRLQSQPSLKEVIGL